MQPPPKSSDQCEACRSVTGDRPGFMSHDTKAQISYISGQYPEQPQLYGILRHACVRSLNCEVCPGREGPIVFGEEGGCHTFSYTFNLQDSQSRGFSRLYSFIVVMMDRVFLINLWPFLVKHFKVLIDELKSKAEAVFTREQDELKTSHGTRSLRSSLSGMPGPDYLRCIRANESGRSLVELSGDKEIFVYLHKYFVFLLKAGGQRMTECVVEGPPRTTAGPESYQEGVGTASIDFTDSANLLEKQVSSHEFHVVRVEGQPSFQTLYQMYQALGTADFLELAYHTAKGDQVIVRGNDVTLVTSVINILKELVPESCCRIVPFSQSYKESFVCNFLGLASSAAVPHHVVESEYHVLVDLKLGVNRGVTAVPGQLEGEEALHQYKLTVSSGGSKNVEQKCPLYLKRLISLLAGDISETLFTKGLKALKEEWMNKVKVLYKFSQMGGLDVPQRNDRLQRLLNDVLQVSQEDLPILQNWRSALSKEYKTHLMHSN